MAIGQRVTVMVNGQLHKGRVVDVEGGSMQLAIMGNRPIPDMVWVKLPN